ncbi:M20/M25/M40 family metallo-hydrolase, partial [Lysobacter sp. 2RAB21]
MACLAAGLLSNDRVAAGENPQAHAHAATASLRSEHDPLAPVYIVTSEATGELIDGLARNSVSRRDSLGKALQISQIKAHQLSQISETIHGRENRCGGYFAFDTREQAEAFIRNDKSAAAASRSLAADYSIDNQATVNPWLDSVSESRIYDTIDHLQSYKNRYYTSSYGKSAAEWIKSAWAGLAATRTDVTAELFDGCSNCSTQPSVILTVKGASLPDEVVVLGAHLDSINGSAGGSAEQSAPGADDDASGVATLTEVIRVALANGWKPKRTVKFMAYAAEEVGLRGSNAIAQKFKTDGVNVVGVLQLDMTNYRTGTPETMQLVTDYSNADLKTFVTDVFDAYLAPLGLTRGTITCGYGCSDHASWTSAGFPAAMMFESGTDAGKNTPAFKGYNPYIHSSGDTLANMGESAVPSVPLAKLALAFMGELAKTGSAAPANTPPVANFTSAVSGLK